MKKFNNVTLILFLFIIFSNINSVEASGHTHSNTSDSSVIDATIWTDKVELFMEYEPPVKGQRTEFISHFTNLSDFKPIVNAQIILETTTPSGEKLQASVEKPIRAGIFKPSLTFPEAGMYEIKVSVISEGITDRLLLQEIIVYESPGYIKHRHRYDTGEHEITFLKEQQWMLGLKTAVSARETLYESIPANARVIPKQGAVAEITTPIPGKIMLDSDRYRAPVIGENVNNGQTLAIINPLLPPSSIELNLTQTKERLSKSKSDLERARQLYQSGAISLKRLQEAELTYKIEASQHKNLSAELASYKTFQSSDENNNSQLNSHINYIYLNSPISGTIVKSNFLVGAYFDVHDILFTVIDLTSVWIEARIYEHDIPGILSSKGATFRIPGYPGEIFPINDKTGRMINAGIVVDEETRTVPVIYEVTNPEMKLRIGMFPDLNIHTSTAIDSVVIPQSSILDEDGRYTVFVHVGGESFVKRAVTVGITDRGMTEIKSGINPGERVVTDGAYQLKLASMKTGVTQGHGHVH